MNKTGGNPMKEENRFYREALEIKEQLDEMEIDYQMHRDISCIIATIGSGEKCFLLR